MVEKWVHLNELGGDPWVLPIWASVNDAINKGKVKGIPGDLSELGVYISVRLNMLPRVASRIRQEVAVLIKAVGSRTAEHEFTTRKEGYAFKIDDDLKYQLLIDIDSLLFELNSLCELMTQFFENLHSLAGAQIPKENVGPSIKAVLDAANQDSSWFITLDNHRNFFMHRGAPYIAVDVSPTLNGADVLVMKENLKSFADKEKFIRLSEIEEIVNGFVASKPVIQAHLCGLFTA